MSTGQSCTDRDKQALVAYLYDECAPAERDQVEAHLSGCSACADQVASFRSARESLGTWTLPEAALGLRIVSARDGESPVGWRQRLRPAVGLAAAAGLVLGVALSLGGAEVSYGDGGLVFRVGRSAPTTSGPDPVVAPWQPDLVALENERRRDLAPLTGRGASVDRDVLLQQVRGLIAESERRQQRERALWLTEFAQELDMQRRADQQLLQQELGALEGYADYLVRVSR